MKWFKMGTALRKDSAENSIMQAIAIAVSAIMLMAGSMLAPGMIQNARLASAQTNLGVIAGAEASYLARTGSYATQLLQLKSVFMGKNLDFSQCSGSNPDNCPAIKIISGGDIANGNCYMVFNTLPSGAVYFIQNKSLGDNSSIVQIPTSPWPSTPKAVKPGTDPTVASNLLPDFPANYDSGCAPWPTSLTAITNHLVASPPTISGTMINGAIGSAYSQFPYTTGSPTFALVSGVLPTGLTLNTTTGEVGGSPTAGGSWTFSIKATNPYGSDTSSFTIGVPGKAPTITGALPDAPVSVAYSAIVTTTDSPAVTLTSGTLPSGLFLDSSNGHVHGTPTVIGTSTFSLTATNVYGAASQAFTIAIGNVPTLSGSFPNGTIGTAYSRTISVTGSPTGYAITTGSLPPGLSLGSTSGAISGTPTATSSSTFTITATNQFGSGSNSFTLSTAAAPTISSISTMPNGAVNSYYNQGISATGSPTFSIAAGSLPAGLSLGSTNGAVTGTPTAAGTSNFTVTVTNGYGTASKAFTIATGYVPTVSGSFPNGTIGSAYNYSVSTTGSPYGYSVTSGSLPPGLSLGSTNGAVTGTPSASANSTFTVTVTNGYGTGSGSFYISTAPAPSISSVQTLPNGTASSPYNQTISATGGVTFSITAGALPAGLSLGAVSGAITGTPTTAATSNFTVTVTNSYGTGSRGFTIAINAMPAPTGLQFASLRGFGANFSWNSVSNATGYNLTYNSTNSQASGTTYFSGTGTSGTLTLSSAWAGTVYVTATNGSNTALGSSAVQTNVPGSQMYGANNPSLYPAHTNGWLAATAASSLTSTDGHYSLIMQADGNLVVYNEWTSNYCGATGTQNYPGATFNVQTNSNLVLYSAGSTTGASNPIKYVITGNYPGSRLAMQTDGNLVEYNSAGTAIWALHSGPAQTFMTNYTC